MLLLPLRPGCPPECPACRHRQWPLGESLAQKQGHLAAALGEWRDKLQPIRTAEEPLRWGYRSRVKLAARWMGDQWSFGLEPRDDFIPTPECPVQSRSATEAMRILASALPPDQPLRYFIQNRSLVTLLFKSRERPDTSWLNQKTATALEEAGIQGLFLHLNPAAGRILYSKNGWHHVWGEKRVQDEQGLWHGPASFLQLLPSLYCESLDAAEAFLEPVAATPVIDLYCGIGATLVRWRNHSADVIGVECDAEALACAAANAPGAALLRGLCHQRIPQLRQWLGQRGSVAYVNPPRPGLEPEVAHWLAAEARPRRLAYLSCSAGTLRRDLHHFVRMGYCVQRLQPYDFFPQTHHVESLALLSLNHGWGDSPVSG